MRRDGAGLKLCDVLAERGHVGLCRDEEDAALRLTPVHGAEERSVAQGLNFGVHQPRIRVSVERVRLHHADDGLVLRGLAELSLVRYDAGQRADCLRAFNIGDPRSDATEKAEQPAEQLEAQDEQDDDEVGDLIVVDYGLAHRITFAK